MHVYSNKYLHWPQMNQSHNITIILPETRDHKNAATPRSSLWVWASCPAGRILSSLPSRPTHWPVTSGMMANTKVKVTSIDWLILRVCSDPRPGRWSNQDNYWINEPETLVWIPFGCLNRISTITWNKYNNNNINDNALTSIY